MAIVQWRQNPWGFPTLSQMLDDRFFDIDDLMNAVDVYEDEDDNVVVKMQMPGFNEKDIKITVEGSTLQVRAEAKEEVDSDKNKKKYFRKEIRQQSVLRSITLPTTVASDKAKAQYKDGILTLILPKAEEAKPKEISLSASEEK